MNTRAFLAWFAIGHLANDWPVAALWLIVPSAGVALGLSPAEVGLLFTFANVGAALAYLPAGILADHLSDRGRLLVATSLWVATGYCLASLAPGFWSLALVLALAGMGNAAWHPVAAGVLTHQGRERRAHALGIHALGGSAAEVLAPLCAGFLLILVDWRAALAISALPAFVLGVCFIRVARLVPHATARPVRKHAMLELLRTWRRANGMRILMMICLYNMALMALLSMIPLYLAEARGLAAATIGLTFSFLLVTGAVVQPWVGALSDRFGRKPIIVIGNLAAGIAASALTLQPSFWPMLAAMLVAVAAIDAIRSATLAATVDQTEDLEGTTLGLAFLIMDGVGALGAVLAGIAASYSWSHMFAAAALFSLGAAMLALATTFVGPADQQETIASCTDGR